MMNVRNSCFSYYLEININISSSMLAWNLRCANMDIIQNGQPIRLRLQHTTTASLQSGKAPLRKECLRNDIKQPDVEAPIISILWRMRSNPSLPWLRGPLWPRVIVTKRVLHHHHHVVPLARISLTLSRHFSLMFITSGRSSGLHPVSSQSCCMYIRAGRPAFARPYVGVHRSTSLMSSSLLL